MCTLALYFRQFENYPLVIAANRDEHFSRATAGPQIWPTNPRIAAGKDLVAGGTWLGVNARGTAAGIVNPRGSLDAAPAPREREGGCAATCFKRRRWRTRRPRFRTKMPAAIKPSSF